MHDGKQLNKDAFNRWLKKYCLMAGVTPHYSHKIRFTVTSMLYKNGVPLTTLQQLLGHTTSAMTLHYLRPVTPLEETYKDFLGYSYGNAVFEAFKWFINDKSV